MASSNMPSKKNKHSNPTVLRLSFECPAGGATQYIDTAMALSIINRKFFRQSPYFYINSVEVYNDEQGVVDIHTAPDNWVTRNAHARGEAIWDKMNDLIEYPLSAGIRPKYHDFKIFLNELHRATGSLDPSLYTVNGTALSYGADDWEYSRFVSADSDGDMDPADPTQINQNADEFYSHLLGGHTGSSDNWTSISLVKSYEDSRAQVPASSPTLDADLAADPLINIFDYSTEEQMNEIIENLMVDNDNAPYNSDNMVGAHNSSMQHVARIGTETGLGRVGRASGFCAPFGLICIDPHSFASGSGTTFRVVLNIAAGNYKGVYAERA